MTALVVGVDPGVTTGVVALTYVDGRASDLREPVALQVRGHRAVSVLVQALIDSEAIAGRPARPLLAVEKFVVSTRASRSRHARAGAVTRALVAELEALALDHAAGTALEVVTRPAALVKPWATDSRLAAAGLVDVTEGMRHARDAARHALYAAVHARIATDPLSAKASVEL